MNVLIISSHKLISSFLMVFSALRNSLSLSLSLVVLALGIFLSLILSKKVLRSLKVKDKQATHTIQYGLGDLRIKKTKNPILNYSALTGIIFILLAVFAYNFPEKYQLTKLDKFSGTKTFALEDAAKNIPVTGEKTITHSQNGMTMVLAATDTKLSVANDQSKSTFPLDAVLTNKDGNLIEGQYSMRFALYTTNRTEIDPYPSDTDQNQKLWEEIQTVTIKNGIFNVDLGQVNTLPVLDSLKNNQFYVGIRVEEDSEMVPRKKITPSLFAYNATNASLLNGKKIGNQSGDIVALNANGKINLQNMPIGTGKDQLITGNDNRLSGPLTLSGAKYLTLFSQKLTANKIKLSSDTQGTLPVSQGGTGLTTNPENGRVLMGTGSGYALGTLTGQSNIQITSTNSNIAISLKDVISVGGLSISGNVPADTTNHLYNDSGNLYWGSTNLSSGGTTYTASGTLLQLSGTTFSLKEGTLNDTKLCTYSTANGLVCNTDQATVGVETDPIFSVSPAFGITGGNITSWNAKENALTFSTGFARVGNVINNTDLGSAQNIFKTIAVSGQSNVTANQNSATLTLAAGANVTLTTNPGTSTVTVAATDTNTTYTVAASPNLLQLTGNQFSLKQGTMTDTKLCVYSATSGLICDTSTSSFTHNPATINSTANGLSVDGSQQIYLALASTSTTGALSNTDWNIFNAKQPAGSYLTANQNITLGGDVTGSGATAITTVIGNDKITESMLKESTNTPANGNILTYNGATQGFAWVATTPTTAHNLFSSSHADMASTTPIQGDIIYYTGTQWTTLDAGTSGNFLRTNGTGANPSWQTAIGTTYTAAANNLLQLSSNEFSVRQGAMTDTKLCTYATASGLVCDTSTSSFTHNPATINSTANGLSVDGSQQISLALSSASTTGALNSTDWNTFNNKQPAGSYLTSFTELDPRLPIAGTNGNLLKSDGSAWTSWTPNFLTGTKVDSFNTRTGAVTLTGADVTTALAFTPYNATNPSNYLSTVDISANTNLAVSGTLLRLTGDTLSLKEGLLTSGKLCTYDGTNLVCDTSSSSVGHTPATINSTANGLSIDGAQQISLALSSTSATGALSNTDWNTFNNKQPAGSYLTSYTETDPVFSAWNKSAGISITESQISDLKSYLTIETDPIFLASQAHNITAGHLTILGNTSGTNSGDNAVNSLYSGLAASKQDALSGTGFVRISGTTISYDNSIYVTGTPWTGMRYLTSFTETDPTISAWAKVATKPTYTAAEIGLGNVPNLTFSGSNTGDETNATIKTKLGFATTTLDGYLTTTDWNVFNGKQPALGFTPYDATNPNNYITSSSLHNAVTLSASNGLSLSTQALSLGLASTSAIGALSNTDWNTFSGKQNNLGFTPYNSTNPNSYVSFANILTVDGTGSGLDADKLDGFDSSAFGDATAENQLRILERIGLSADGISANLFAGQKVLSDKLGTNDANNTFDSSAVVANADGSVLERLESIQSSSGFVCNRDTVKDADGNYYRTISVGAQCWMSENLRTGTMLASGSTMPANNGIIEKWCYSNDIAYCNQEGGLYHWDEAMAYSTTEGAQGICPTGWHIPKDAEQYVLEKYLTDAASTCDASRNGAWDCTSAGTKLKSGGTSGYSAPLAGFRNADGTFLDRTTTAYIWSSSQSGSIAWSRGLNSTIATVYRYASSKAYGFSVRCLKD
jgi:uncharacterized protein (TIGR02145 family)